MNWLKTTWTRFKRWIYGILLFLGLATAVVAQAKTLSWTHPDQRVDGTPLAITEIAETRIYCDGGAPVSVVAPAAVYEFMLPGSHSCYATTVDTFGLESDPSNTITFEVLPARPAAPVLSVN